MCRSRTVCREPWQFAPADTVPVSGKEESAGVKTLGEGQQVLLVREAHLHRMDPGLGATNALHCGDSGAVQLA